MRLAYFSQWSWSLYPDGLCWSSGCIVEAVRMFYAYKCRLTFLEVGRIWGCVMCIRMGWSGWGDPDDMCATCHYEVCDTCSQEEGSLQCSGGVDCPWQLNGRNGQWCHQQKGWLWWLVHDKRQQCGWLWCGKGEEWLRHCYGGDAAVVRKMVHGFAGKGVGVFNISNVGV